MLLPPSMKAAGNASGQGLRSAACMVTRLNQYTNRTVPAALDILGLANPVATVTGNSSTNVYRWGEYFWKEPGIDNSRGRQWGRIYYSEATPLFPTRCHRALVGRRGAWSSRGRNLPCSQRIQMGEGSSEASNAANHNRNPSRANGRQASSV